MVIIPLIGLKAGGRNAIVDEVDKDLLTTNWYYLESGYVYNSTKKYLHQNVLTPKLGFVIDHINGNKLDNQRHNLRYATYSQNNINRKSLNPNWRHITPEPNGYKVCFTRKNKPKYLGHFSTYLEALEVRNSWLLINEPMYKLKPELYAT